MISIIGSTVLIGGGVYFFHSSQDTPPSSYPKIAFVTPRPDDPYLIAKTGTHAQKQAVLEEAFAKASPSYLSHILYDPELSHAKRHLESLLATAGFSNNGVLSPDSEAKLHAATSHLMMVISEMHLVGNNQKRPIFVKKEFWTDPSYQCIEDVISAIHHEDVHGKQENIGYEFGTTLATGNTLIPLIEHGLARSDVLAHIGEIPAYARQLELAINGKQRVSEAHFIGTKKNLLKLVEIFSRALLKEQLTPPEAQYADATLVAHAKLIKTLRTF